MELAILIGAYMLPWIFAVLRGSFSSGGIFVLNLLLGWTVIFWIIALVWAFGSENPSTARRRARYYED